MISRKCRIALLAVCLTLLLCGGALAALLSGSGSAVFGLFDHENTARDAAKALRDVWPETFLARPV